MNNLEIESIGSSTVVSTYRYFYYLANEMAHKSVSNPHSINSVRYSVATVILSYTTIETFINHLLHAKDSIVSDLSSTLTEKIEKMNLIDKLELAYALKNKADSGQLIRGTEPIQSLDLLREVRNYLIHNMPVE